ncbi:MAG: ribonucleoside triphosphate reductase [Patescibacteria group bacterium]|nr:ribonucleoside triphosphate reductase [Patescibacteria group bacterium]MDD5121692.1 ribonucleoside triphosphate reductase [Patescibacteria group bacterium]MDD5221687.1 ribonucleoside triphosphate reductase [Patescibacteria group bacterium]MDD5396144.1 ribonucleoside triphosphate reductase [Patescibacteria group bacterium]
MPKTAKTKIANIKKRDGQLVAFDQSKITNAIYRAVTAVEGEDGKLSKKLSKQVVEILNRRFKKTIPSVEDIQDIVEEVLILSDLVEIARAYILYREQRRKIRESNLATQETVSSVDQYLEELDWEVHENANMAYSLQGLNHYVTTSVIKQYWLNKFYPKEIREAAKGGDFHIHNLDCLGPYCMGWDLYDFLVRGFGGVVGKIETKPAKHLRTALGHLVNLFYTLQGESAGAQAVSSFDTLLAPFIRFDNLDYKGIKQAVQEFLFNCSVPTRVGFQTPFTNISLDIKSPSNLANTPVIIGGKPQKETYGEFQEEMNMLNKALFECMTEGDAKKRVFTFPIPTISIGKDFNWEDPALDTMWEATAKYGINYFSNFIQSDMKPEDVRSMCCRLRLDKRELYKRGGGLFGANPLTGSMGVVTLNLPRIGYLSKNEKEFFARLSHLMDLAKESLEIKRKGLEDLIEKGLYPYSKFYLSSIKKVRGSYWANHFATIGIVGMNEALLNFVKIKKDITTKEGKAFAIKVMDFMRDKLLQYQEETSNIYNLESTPAESTSYRLAEKDKLAYPDIITSGEKVPYYTNSTQLPVNFSNDIFTSLKLQDDLQTKYTGGTVFHIWLGERLPDGKTCKKLVKRIFENFKLPYITFTPTFSICPKHGYLSGEHEFCPICDEEIGYKK